MKSFSSICLATAFLFSLVSKAQTVTTFDVPGGVNTQPVAISPSGQITGLYQVPNTTMVRGFLRDIDGAIITFDVDGTNTVPSAINAAGQVAGIYTANSAAVPPFHGFLRQFDGTIITFDAPDAWDTEATAMNARGEIAGWTQLNFSPANPVAFEAFLRSPDGSITTFDLDGANILFPSAINARGQVIGYWTDANAARGRGFLREPAGRTSNIDAPGPFITNTWPYAINARGEIAGAYAFQCPFPPGSCDTNTHSFLRLKDGNIENVDVPQMTYSVAVALDSKGEVAGYAYENSTQQMHGFLRKSDGTFQTFEAPNSNWTVPVAMTPAGEITGVYFDANGAGHGFVLSQ